MTVHNFSAGPAVLPAVVLEAASRACVDWEGRGISVMTISHRSDAFMDLAARMTALVRELLHVPDAYHVLWMAGGARTQYAAIPMHLGRERNMCFVDTGYWSRCAMAEARRFGKVHCVASSGPDYHALPPHAAWQTLDADDTAYLHVVDNETVHGLAHELDLTSKVPTEIADLRWVSDMTSNIFARPFDVAAYQLVYAASQKNMGPAGLTMVLAHDALLREVPPGVPTMLAYQTYADSHSLYNTPPTLLWYVVSEMLAWIKAQGGVPAMATRSREKSQRLYRYIDESDCYVCRVHPAARSEMNVVFDLCDPSRRAAFLVMAAKRNLVGLKGHSAVGGLRASLYNGLEMEAVEALIDMMEAFKHSK